MLAEDGNVFVFENCFNRMSLLASPQNGGSVVTQVLNYDFVVYTLLTLYQPQSTIKCSRNVTSL